MSHIKDRLNDYYNQMKTLTEDHQMILSSDALCMVEQLQDDSEEDRKENKQWIRRLRGSINGIRDIICNTDEIKIATCRVQEYMRNHGSDEEFIQNINNDFVLGFMISQRMMHDDFQVVWEEYLEDEA